MSFFPLSPKSNLIRFKSVNSAKESDTSEYKYNNFFYNKLLKNLNDSNIKGTLNCYYIKCIYYYYLYRS